MASDLKDIYSQLERSKRELIYKIRINKEKLERLEENLARVEETMKEVRESESDADSAGRDGEGA